MNALATTEPISHLVRITDLVPLDEIAGPNQPNGPWLVVAIIPASDYRRIVVIDEHGTEYDVSCDPSQTVLRRS
ncbi:MAG: hypothetical protein L0I24_24495 [Pseudonocardia sp.]|nr:hypothetical protein [Pseudonocardia sp.]